MIRVLVESGSKKVLATAVDWPGWTRGAKSEEMVLDTLIAYGERYRRSVGRAAGGLDRPRGLEDLDVVARVPGGSGADFGVPSSIAEFDRLALDPAELERHISLLRGAWAGFDEAVSRTGVRELAKGPRGGGRSLHKIVEHVREAERSAYIGQLGAASVPPAGSDMATVHAAFIEALMAKTRGELPERGPRGGERWPAAFAIRRAAWHALDHAWEIEDRVTD